MRCTLVLALLLGGAACAGAAPAPDAPANSAAILFRLHPRPWHPPSAAASSRVVARPASAGLVIDDPGTPSLAATRPSRAARVTPDVALMPDGSTVALLGGRIRAYTVVRIGADGRLVEDCARSEAAARRLLDAPAPAGAYVEK